MAIIRKMSRNTPKEWRDIFDRRTCNHLITGHLRMALEISFDALHPAAMLLCQWRRMLPNSVNHIALIIFMACHPTKFCGLSVPEDETFKDIHHQWHTNEVITWNHTTQTNSTKEEYSPNISKKTIKQKSVQHVWTQKHKTPRTFSVVFLSFRHQSFVHIAFCTRTWVCHCRGSEGSTSW